MIYWRTFDIGIVYRWKSGVFFFSRITNPAIWLVVRAGKIFLSLPTGNGNRGKILVSGRVNAREILKWYHFTPSGATKCWIFFLLKWNFSLTKRCKTNTKKNQHWNKRISYSPNRRVFMWFYWLNFAGLQFCEIWFFLQCWHAVVQLYKLNIANFRTVFWAQFSVHVCYFHLSFIF